MKKRSKFSLSNYKLLTCNQGELVPIGLTEVLPGDTIQQVTNALVRVSPLVSPVMHPVHVRIHHWFVPHRLVMDDFEDFITGGSDGNDATTFPTITIGGGSGASIGSLADYLGVPTGVNNIEVSALPFRGYALIWNEHYRDQDLETELTIDTTDGADTTTNTTLQNVAWEKDYFTSSRPWTQKGSEVSLPLGTSANIYTDVNAPNDIGVYSTAAGAFRKLDTDGSAGGTVRVDSATEASGNLYADLSTATSATINDLREAMALQKYKEARARYGSRYTEYLRYLGVESPDSRLQRPEYLGGGKQTIQFSEVLQTAPSIDDTSAESIADLKGHGISAMRTNRYRKYFQEHGYIFTLLSVKPKAMYSQGLAKHWIKTTKEDFFQKELQFIGQEEILNKEIYAGHATPDGTFGYQDRYDEYRRGVNTISGDFRDTLDYWHMAREFTSDPALNATFVKCNPTNRIYASTSADQLLIMANHSIQARRMVAKTGTPGGF
jgi:hypothetical protein